MDASGRLAAGSLLLRDFATRTGVRGPDASARRYLWTDAAAVESWIEIHRATDDPESLELARALVGQVHRVLGRHRADDSRRGWISGLGEEEGLQRPTAGGLRIGKPLAERAAGEAFDERLEWDRDGQYFHYLTRWMAALDALAVLTGETRWSDQAVELARTAVARFSHRPAPGVPWRVHWKMSIDLSRPLVPSMGQHDPLDGLATMLGLRATRRLLGHGEDALGEEISRLFELCSEGASWSTPDPLGIGGLLSALARFVQAIARGQLSADQRSAKLLSRLVSDAQRSLAAFVQGHEMARAPETRLAFRELGLAIGLQELALARAEIGRSPESFGGMAGALATHLDAVLRHFPLVDRVEGLWRTPAAQRASAWREHEDINAVMLARSLTIAPAADGGM